MFWFSSFFYCISICLLFFVPLVILHGSSSFFVVLCCFFVFVVLCSSFLVAVCRFLLLVRERGVSGVGPQNAAPPPPRPANQQKCLIYGKRRIEPEQTNFKGLYLNRAEIRHRVRNVFARF